MRIRKLKLIDVQLYDSIKRILNGRVNGLPRDMAGVEIVLVIDDSGSMTSNDRKRQRLQLE